MSARTGIRNTVSRSRHQYLINNVTHSWYTGDLAGSRRHTTVLSLSLSLSSLPRRSTGFRERENNDVRREILSHESREIAINEGAFFASRERRSPLTIMAKLSSALIYASQLTVTARMSVIKHQLVKFLAGEACLRCNLKWKAMLSHYTVACALINLSLLSETCN